MDWIEESRRSAFERGESVRAKQRADSSESETRGDLDRALSEDIRLRAAAILIRNGTNMRILVVTELRQGKWNNASFETLAAAQQIAKDTSSAVSALVIGKGAPAFANQLASKNVAEVLAVEHDLLEAYT